MTDGSVDTEVVHATPLNDRVVYALRQAGFVSISLLIAGLVTERARPVELLDRGMASTPYLWAIVAWIAVLLINAIAFEQTQMRVLERTPLYCGLGAGAFVFLTGLVSLGEAGFGRRLIFSLGNALGAVMFWWAVASLIALAIRKVSAT